MSGDRGSAISSVMRCALALALLCMTWYGVTPDQVVAERGPSKTVSSQSAAWMVGFITDEGIVTLDHEGNRTPVPTSTGRYAVWSPDRAYLAMIDWFRYYPYAISIVAFPSGDVVIPSSESPSGHLAPWHWRDDSSAFEFQEAGTDAFWAAEPKTGTFRSIPKPSTVEPADEIPNKPDAYIDGYSRRPTTLGTAVEDRLMDGISRAWPPAVDAYPDVKVWMSPDGSILLLESELLVDQDDSQYGAASLKHETAVWISNPDGTGLQLLERGGRSPAWLAHEPPAADSAKEYVDLVCVMARKDRRDFRGQGKRDSFEAAIESVRTYLHNSSNGNLAIGEVIWVPESGENSIEIDFKGRPKEKWQEWARAVSQHEAVAAAIDLRQHPDRAYSVIVLVPATVDGWSALTSAGWSVGWSQELETRRGGFITLYNPRPRTVAHELMHGMGVNRRVMDWGTARKKDKQEALLPDLYHTDGWKKYYGVPDFSNLTTNNRASSYFLMAAKHDEAPDEFIPALSGFSQHWLEWVEYDRAEWSTTRSASTGISVPNLSATASAGTRRVPIIHWERSSEQAYLVLEGRSLDNEHGTEGQHGKKANKWWRGDGIVLYKIRQWPVPAIPGAGVEGAEDWRPDKAALWIRGIDYLETINHTSPSYNLVLAGEEFSKGGGFTLRFASDTFSGSADSHRVELMPWSSSSVSELQSARASVGLALTPDSDVAWPPAIALIPREDGPYELSAQETPFPDLDLHVMLADGRRIGMNYETGEFENPVPEAIVSGDLSFDTEWILLPPDLAEGATFEISNYDTEKVIEFYEGLSEADLVIGYEVTPTIFDEHTLSSAQGDPVSGELSPGESSYTVVEVGEDEITASVPASGPPADDSEALKGVRIPLMLIGAAVLFIAGILALLWSRRRRSE